jgi:8-amino-3,8-dideoxy-alpha-D-manno-octulosonate transaminase
MSASGAGALAIEGGLPVRSTKLETNFPGPVYYDDEERRELLDVLDRRAPFRWYGIGPKGQQPNKCNQFEKEFAAHMGTKYCVAVTSGTAALVTAVAALGAGPGDEVILPAWTWYACYDAIIAAGATPVFAEIDDSMNIDPTDVERHITPRTKIIMPVHIMGEPADMEPILAIGRRHRLKVLEDGAQSLGATYKGRPLGSMGDCGIYSFQVCKTISAGEGGAVLTNDPEVFERLARIHDLGQLRDPHAAVLGRPPCLDTLPGFNFRMSEYTGAVMRAQLRKLDRIVADFRDKGRRVEEGIQGLPGIQCRKLSDPQGGLRSSVYFRTSGKAQRDRFAAALGAENIPAGIMEGSVILPLEPFIEKKQTVENHWPSFSGPEKEAVSYGAACCPRTVDIRDRYVGVPMDPKYSDQDVADLIAAVRKVYTALVRA